MSKKRVDYTFVYTVPENYVEPSPEELPNNVDYPHLNTMEYRLLTAKPKVEIYSCYDFVTIDKHGLVNLVTNNLTTRSWAGCAFGFKSFEDLAKNDVTLAVYRINGVEGHISAVKPIQKDCLFLTQTDGTVRLFSLNSDMRPTDSTGQFCVFEIGFSYEQEGQITGMDVDRVNETRAITGDSRGCLRTWDLLSNITPVATRRNAHTGKISEVSAAPSNTDEYVTCGMDRKVLIWDERQPLPALSLWNENIVDYSTIYWSTSDEPNELVFVGDIKGCVTVLDPRVPKTRLLRKKVTPGLIKSFTTNGKKMVVNNYSRSTVVCELGSGRLDTIYEYSSAPNHVMSAAWEDDNTFWTVGWDRFVKKHVLDN